MDFDSADTGPTNFTQYWMSNASMNVFPDNKPQKFKIQLAHPQQLKGQWEMGLSSIFYPNNWNNIKHTKFLLKFALNASGTSHSYIDVSFDANQYPDIPSLLKHLNDVINNEVKAFIRKLEENHSANSTAIPSLNKYFEFVEVTTTAAPWKKIKLNVAAATHAVKFDPNSYSVFGALGFAVTQKQINKDEIGKFQPSLNMHFPALFIYTPLINDVDVGDTKAKLLSLVPIQGKTHEIVYVRFEKPVYNRITHNYINEVEVEILDDVGEPVQFLAGKVMMTVHFRRLG